MEVFQKEERQRKMTIKEKRVINFALNLNESYESFLKYSNKYHNKEFEQVAHDYLKDWSVAYTVFKKNMQKLKLKGIIWTELK